MATTQQVQFAETIRAMKVALKRRPDGDSDDSDTSLHAHTNRGHKLQRRAQFVREGRLDDTGGLGAYRRVIQHAGYTRAVISRHAAAAARYEDGDGDRFELSASDVENERPLPEGVEPVVEDAFAGVRLEALLRPLTNPAELPHHPGLSAAYTSPSLTVLTEETLEDIRREREKLWKAKRLLLRFRGDADWLPGERFENEGDETLLDEDGGIFGDALAREDGSGVYGEGAKAEDVTMDGIETADMATLFAGRTSRVEDDAGNTGEQENGADKAREDQSMANGAPSHAEPATITTLENPLITSMRDRSRDPDAASEDTSTSGKETNGTNAPSHSMTTRARARSPVASERASPSPSDSASIPSVNPWFLIPPSAVPDRDLGLPTAEAEETRRLLLLYVQKQENVVRSLEALYSGLQKTDRVRHEVFRACKAEGHLRDDGKGNLVTEMSDGEDWYDVEEWQLQPWELKMGKGEVLGLEKGKDEVEDVEEEGRRGTTARRRRVNRM